ncbi:hypothetical protein ACFHW2_40910 [Actinomadura sp. LOL_016]|uniref:hypothetical protein n=1 Tax=unclassified Actinomadura TaxID=2626254 RepID=UPI003A7FAB56
MVSTGVDARILQLEVRRRKAGGDHEAELKGPLPTEDDAGLRESFAAAFEWARSSARLQGSVTEWRITDPEEPGGQNPASGRSASGAMALALAYLHGITPDGRRPYNRRIVLSATVSPDGALGTVTQLRTKVPVVARAGLDLAVSSSTGSIALAEAEDQGIIPTIGQVADVATALSLFRVRRSRHPFWIAPALAVLAVLALGGWATLRAGAEERSRRATELVSFADEVTAARPGDAAVAALAAHRMDPDDHGTRNALLRITALDPRLRGALPDTVVSATTISPDGAMIAVGGVDHSVRLYGPGDGHPREAVLGGAATSALAFTPDGRSVISASDAGVVVRWDVTRPAPQPTVLGNAGGPVDSLSLSPDGRTLMVLPTFRQASLWSAKRPTTDPITLPVSGPSDVVFVDESSVAVIPMESAIQKAMIYDISGTHPRRMRTLENDTEKDRAISAAITELPDGRRALAIGTALGNISIWDTTRWQVVLRVKAEGAPFVLTGGRNSNFLLVGVGKGSRRSQLQMRLEVLDLGKGRWSGPPLGPPEIRFQGTPHIDANGNRVVAITTERHLTVWSVRPIPPVHDAPITEILTHPRAPRLIIAGAYTGLIRLITVPDKRIVRTIDASPYSSLTAMAVSPDGHTLATGHIRGQVVVWDLATGRALQQLSTPSSDVNVTSLAFDGASRRLAAGSMDGTTRLWDLSSAEHLRDIPPAGSFAARVLLFSSHEDELTIGYEHATAKIVKLRGGEAEIVTQLMGISALLPISNTTLLLTNNSGTIQVVDRNLRPVGRQPVARHPTNIADAAVSPDGRRWLTGGWDGTARVIDAKRGTEIARVENPESAHERTWDNYPRTFKSVTFSGDGRYAVFATTRGRVSVLDMDLRSSIERACALILNGAYTAPRVTKAEQREVATICH